MHFVVFQQKTKDDLSWIMFHTYSSLVLPPGATPADLFGTQHDKLILTCVDLPVGSRWLHTM